MVASAKYKIDESALVVRSDLPEAQFDAALASLPGDHLRVSMRRQGLRLLELDRDAVVEQAMRSLRLRLGPKFHVYPLLRDAADQAVLPTGRLTVRFRSPLAARELEAFAQAHGLALAETSTFAPQAIFEPASDDAMLLQAVVDAADDVRVRAAWPETAAVYEKLGKA
jgi:hypothetical protein